MVREKRAPTGIRQTHAHGLRELVERIGRTDGELHFAWGSLEELEGEGAKDTDINSRRKASI